MVSIVSLGILLGIITSLDISLAPKKKGAFTRQLVTVLTSSIPAIYTAILGKETMNEFTETFFRFFYPTYLLTIIVSFVFLFFLIFKPAAKRIDLVKTTKFVTFLDFLFLGYQSFKERIEQIREDNIFYSGFKSEELLDQINELSGDTSEFIMEISRFMNTPIDFDGFALYIFERLTGIFFSETDIRLTLWMLNEENERLIPMISTREDILPGEIPIKERNLFTRSMELGRPLIYSENTNYHFNTKNRSIENGVYNDYSAYCLTYSKGDNRHIPFLCLSLDCRSESSIKRMHTLVKSGYLKIATDFISEKAIEES